MVSYENSIIYLYNTLVGRDPDQAGFDYWLSQLNSGNIELGGLAEALIESPEYSNVKEGVVRLYKAAFGRIPDQEGLDYWAQKINEGAHNLQDVSTLFITSPEFATRFGADPTVDQIVTKMYQNTFARTPDLEGFNYWVEEVNAGLTVSDLLLNFTESAEGVSAMNHHVQTVLSYDSLASRMPTTVELLGAPSQIASMIDVVIGDADYQGPDLSEPNSSITSSFAAGALEVTGSLTGVLQINVAQESIKQGGFDIAVADLDWAAMAEIDVSEATGSSVIIKGADAGMNVRIGADTLAVSLGAGDDTVTISEAPTAIGFVDGGLGANTLAFGKSLSIDITDNRYISFQTLIGSEYGDVLTISNNELASVAIDLGGNAGAGFDQLRITDGGLVNLSGLGNVAGVERWEFADDSVFDFIGSDSADYLSVGVGGGRYAGGAGADTIVLSSGNDYVAYDTISESQQTVDAVDFTGDVIYYFDFDHDFIDLPIAIDGSVSAVTVASAFHSNLAEVLAGDANVAAALAADVEGDDIDAVLVEVLSGGATGSFLIIQGIASSSGYDETTDMIIKMIDSQNASNISGFNLI